MTLPGWRHVYSGKVRDLYAPSAAPDGDGSGTYGSGAEGDRMLVVASDRVSAFDHVLSPGIPGKGELLTTLSLWWFDTLHDVPNHLVPDHRLAAADGADGSDAETAADGARVAEEIPAEVAGRAMLVRRLRMHPIECVVRGYLTGSGFAEYRERGTVCGIPLPAGLGDGDRLPEPLFTPAFKAEQGEHDENISFERVVELVGADTAALLRSTSLDVYDRAAAIALDRGLILADTKLELGDDPATGETVLADEVLTSDSSRYWDAEAWASGSTPRERMASFDKQIVRDWLSDHWNRTGEPPTLPDEIVERTAGRYAELLARLAG